MVESLCIMLEMYQCLHNGGIAYLTLLNPFLLDATMKLKCLWYIKKTKISPTGAGADYYINIDMPRATIQGYDRDLRPTGRLYNRYITSGNFFGIPVGAHIIEVAEPVDLKFNYLYL